MKFSVGTNWDPRLIPALAQYREVQDVYAKLAVDLVGGGRPGYILPTLDHDQAADHIAACHNHGIRFTYLLNASCLDGREFDAAWRDEFARLVDDLVEMGVDRVTVAIPYLIKVIKSRHPKLGVTVSSFAQVNSVERARRFDRLGADEIVLDFLSVQRDFKLLSAMARNVDAQLIALANHTCLYHCPSRSYHANLSSHASQCRDCQHNGDGNASILDYCVLECLHTKLNNPSELIRAQWIRPEDLWHYEEIGIEKFKLVDRARSTDWIIKVVDAYANRRTPGDNLLEILNAVGSGGLPYADFNAFLEADAACESLAHTVGALATKQFLFLDNRELDGFIDRVKRIDCRLIDCEQCGLCADLASRAIRMNPDLPVPLAEQFPVIKTELGSYLTNLYSGQVFETAQGI